MNVFNQGKLHILASISLNPKCVFLFPFLSLCGAGYTVAVFKIVCVYPCRA